MKLHLHQSHFAYFVIIIWIESLFISQCVVKLYHIRYVEDFQWLIYFVQNLYEIHIKTKSKERQAYFRKFSFYTEVLFKILLTLYVLSVFTFLPYPIYMYLFKNEVVTLFPLYMPGVDETSFLGYIFLSSFQFVSLFLATLGVCGCDFIVALIIVSTLIFSKIISLEMQEIENDFLEKNAVAIVRGRFRNIILMHQEMITYMKRVERLTFIMFFGQVGSSSTSSVVILYVILMVINWFRSNSPFQKSYFLSSLCTFPPSFVTYQYTVCWLECYSKYSSLAYLGTSSN